MDVFSGEVYHADVAVHDGVIAGIGEYKAKNIIDASSRILLPAFIDSHIHIESSLLTPAEYASAALLHGTTAAVADPHEIANVLGRRGLRYMLDTSEGLPFDFYFMLPSCVPASRLETSGARLTASELIPLKEHDRVLGLAEMMSYPEVLAGVGETLRKLKRFGDRIIDGHAPGLGGMDLLAYVSTGISSDHESATADEAKEKLRLGMTIYIREGSAAKNLETIIRAVTPENSRFFCLATDDLAPMDLKEGGLNLIIKKAIKLGIPAATAVQMATINPCIRFGLRRNGAIAPGYNADIVIVDDLEDLNVQMVIKKGRVVVDRGRLLAPVKTVTAPSILNTVKPGRIRPEDLRVKARSDRVRVIDLIPNQIETNEAVLPAPVKDGYVVSDTDRDILKLVVIERHHKTGNIGIGLVRSFGLKSGCLASTIAHDSHNIIAVGVGDEDIYRAVMEIIKINGGIVVADKGKVISNLALPVAGLMSDRPVEFVAERLSKLEAAAKRLGTQLEHPFTALSFLALPVIPKLKLTDRGLVDVVNYRIVGLFV